MSNKYANLTQYVTLYRKRRSEPHKKYIVDRHAFDANVIYNLPRNFSHTTKHKKREDILGIYLFIFCLNRQYVLWGKIPRSRQWRSSFLKWYFFGSNVLANKTVDDAEYEPCAIGFSAANCHVSTDFRPPWDRVDRSNENRSGEKKKKRKNTKTGRKRAG